MVGGLAEGGDAAEGAAGIGGGVEDDGLEQRGVHVMRAAEGGKSAAGLEELEGAQVDFLVAAQGVRHGGAAAGEGRRIKDDDVETGNDFLVGLHGGLGLEPVEDVYGFEGAFVGQVVGGGNACGRGDGVGALVEQMDVRRAGASGVQAEPAQKTEAIEHLGAAAGLGDGFVINLLVEIHAGFVAAGEVDFELQAAEVDAHRAVQRTNEDAVGVSETFELAKGRVAPFKDAAGRKELLQNRRNHGLALVHAERGGLQDENVFVFVDDEAAEEIALGVDDAKGSGAGQMLLPDGERGANAFFKKCLVNRDALGGEQTDGNFGFGIVKARAEETLAVVLDLHDRAVVGGMSQTEDRAGVNPRMAGDDAVSFAGTEQDGG